MRSSWVHPFQPRSSSRCISVRAKGTALTNTSSSRATSSWSSAKSASSSVARVLGVLLEHRHEPVGDGRQTRIVGIPIGRLDEIEVHRGDSRILDLAAFECHQRRHLIGDLRRHEDPGVTLHLDRPLRDVELAEPVEVLDRLGRQRQPVASRELGDPLAVTLPLADLGAQAVVDLARSPRRTPPRRRPAARAPATAARRRRPASGSGSARRRLPRRNAGTPTGRAAGSGSKPFGVVVADRSHGHAGVRRELADRQHVRPLFIEVSLPGGFRRACGGRCARRARGRRRAGRRTRRVRSTRRCRAAGRRTGCGACSRSR